MKVTTSITTDDLVRIPERAAELEARGFSGVSAQEGRHDPFIALTLAAAATSQLELMTNVAIAFPRSPMMSAVAAWDLQSLSNGRFTLGLGTQVRAHNEKRYSTPWSSPAARMREYVQALKSIFGSWAGGERLDYRGDHYTFTLMTPNFTPPPLACPRPKVALAAVGPLMQRVAAEECDGVTLHSFCTREYITEIVMPKIDAGLAARGISRADFEIGGGGFVATGATDDAVTEAREWVRKRVGFYGSTPSYWPVFELHGLDKLGPELNRMSKEGRWDDMTGRIDDDVLDLFCAAGRHDQIAEKINARFGGLVDGVALSAETPTSVVDEVRSIS